VNWEATTSLTQGESVKWHIAIRPSKRAALDKTQKLDDLLDQVKKIKASIRAKVEHPFRVIKQPFGFIEVRYRGMKKNTAQLKTLFTLSNLWRARKKLMALKGAVRLETANGV
jgi:transposase, IS5 family